MRAPSAVAQAQGALEAEVHSFADTDDAVRTVDVRLLDEPWLHAEVGTARRQPGASLLKVVTALALFAAAEEKDLDLDDQVPLAALSRTAYPSVLQALDPDRTLSVRELCAVSLITSDNPAAEFVRLMVGQPRIESTITALGLTDTVFPVGFAEEDLGPRGRANLTTAGDMLRVMVHIAETPALADLRRYLINNQRNNRIPERLDDDIVVLHKTGSLTGVVNDVGLIYHPAGRIALAFLCDGEKDPSRAALAIAESTERIVDIVSHLHDKDISG